MAHRLNLLATKACDLLLAPLAKLPPFWGIRWLSRVTSLCVLRGFRWLSSPRPGHQAKGLIEPNILAIRLYRDFWRTIVGSFFRSLFYTGKYFALNLAPLLAVLPLLFLLFVQMDIRYGMRPFRPGETIAVKAVLADGAEAAEAEVAPSPHYRATMNPVHVVALREIDWRLQAAAPGKAAIAIRAGGLTLSKSLVVGSGLSALANKKLAVSSLEHFIHPAEALLEARAPFRSIAIRYPARDVSFLGIRAHWLLWYLLLTFAIALALKNKFGVEF